VSARLHRSRTYRQTEEQLKATGRSWRIEKGARHFKVFLDERMVATFPLVDGRRESFAAAANVRAAIERAARGVRTSRRGP
jgi:hypothetical protein